jgi:hypothetical protein
MRQHNAFTRYVPVADLMQVNPPFNPRDQLPLPGFTGESDYMVLLDRVMNAVSKVEDYNTTNMQALLRHVQNGGGLTCAGMADLYRYVLGLNGIQARRITLVRNLMDSYDTHETVEVFLSGKWVIVDPTFHVSFERDGQLLNAQEINEALEKGTFYTITTKYYGDVKYPARVESYYMHWLPLFDNVFIVDTSSGQTLIDKLPIIRYWLGPRSYYQGSDGIPPGNFLFQDRPYFMLVVALPGLMLSCGFAVLVTGVLRWWRNLIKAGVVHGVEKPH